MKEFINMNSICLFEVDRNGIKQNDLIVTVVILIGGFTKLFSSERVKFCTFGQRLRIHISGII